MRGFISLVLTPVALSLALPQGSSFIDFDSVDALPDLGPLGAPIGAVTLAPTYDADAAADAAGDDIQNHPIVDSSSSKRKRGLVQGRAECAPQPAGYGPVSSPDDATTFRNDPTFSNQANSVDTPSGYTLAFAALNGSTQQSTIGYTTLTQYDSYLCQEWCDSYDQACYAFNLYYERDPVTDPSPSQPNPSSTTNIKCVLYGAFVSPETATNTGQYRYSFEVAIAGSNGYNKNAGPDPVDSFDPPVTLGGAINAPDNSYIGSRIYPGPYNPGQCGAACLATTDYDKQHPRADGSYDTCSFFNSYVLSKNGVPLGTYCGLYTASWGRQYATNYGQYRGSDRYTVGQSYGFTLSS